jgi:hypothetical protein
MKKLTVSPITNTIYLSKVKQDKDNPNWFIIQGEKEDYTDEAIRAVFEWFMNNHKQNEPNEAYEVKFTNCDYVLTMTKKYNIK